MPTVQKKPNGSYEVQWMRNRKRHSKTFKTRSEAKKFSAEIELSSEEVKTSNLTFAEWVEAHPKVVKLRVMSAVNMAKKAKFFNKRLGFITRDDIQEYVYSRAQDISARGREISPATVVREFTSIRTLFSLAVKEKAIANNPCRGVVLPKEPEHRERIATEEEQKLLMDTVKWDGISKPLTTKQRIVAAFIFACKTGMRRGEIMQLQKEWIQENVIYLPADTTKTQAARYVALSKQASDILALVKPELWHIPGNTFSSSWRLIVIAAGLTPEYDAKGRMVKEGLRFHDSRATFATWAASINPKTGAPRLDVLALARQTGHKDLKMLQRYYRPRPETIARMLDE